MTTEIAFHAKSLEYFSSLGNIKQMYDPEAEMMEMMDVIANKNISRSKINKVVPPKKKPPTAQPEADELASNPSDDE